MTDTTARVAVRAYRKPGSCVTGLRGLIHVNCSCRVASTLVGTHKSAKDAEEQVRDMGYSFAYCGKSTHTASQETRKAAAAPAPAPVVEAPAPAAQEVPAQEGPKVHHFTDSSTAYDVCMSSENVKDGDVLLIASEGVIGVLTNAHPVALTEAHGELHPMVPRYKIREMNGGRFAASADLAQFTADQMGWSLLPQHRAPVADEAPADEAPAGVETEWEPGHCTPMMGGAVHEVTSGLDGSDGGPVHIFPLCRTGSMTNQGTRYRKVKAPLTCKNCIGNRDRRRDAQARRAAEAAAPAAPVVDEAPAVDEAPVFVQGERVVCADGMTRTVSHMKRYVADEPLYVVMECGALWIAANCERVEQGEAAPAVEAPAVSDVYRESQAREAAALTRNEQVTEAARAVLLHAGHPEAAEGRAGFLFRTNWLSVQLYAVDAAGVELTGFPLDDAFDALRETLEGQDWFVDYSTTGYHGSSLVLTAPLAEQGQPLVPADQDERTALLEEIGARLAAGLTWSTAAAFQLVHDDERGQVVGWTYRTRSGSEVRYAYVAARGLLLEGFNELRHREDAERELVAHYQAGTDYAELMPPVATYLEAVLATRSTAQLAECLHSIDVDAVKAVAEGPGRLIVKRGPDFMGTIFDAGSKSRRGRYEAWSPYAGTRNNLVGFHATVDEATAAIAHAWPVAAWELAEDTGASVLDVLAGANLLAGEDGVKMHLQITTATGADQKFYRDGAEILRARLVRQQERAAYTRVQEENLRRARAAAFAAHKSPHTFRPFCRPGEEQPAGWTFRVGFGAGARYGVTTPEGVAPIGLYEYVTTAERAFHQAGEAAARAAAPQADEPAAELDEHEAKRHVTGTYPAAKGFEAERDEDGRLIGYTFQVGTLHGACYGWITTAGTFAKALEPYRSHAVALLPMAVRDEQAARR